MVMNGSSFHACAAPHIHQRGARSAHTGTSKQGAVTLPCCPPVVEELYSASSMVGSCGTSVVGVERESTRDSPGGGLGGVSPSESSIASATDMRRGCAVVGRARSQRIVWARCALTDEVRDVAQFRQPKACKSVMWLAL